MLRLTDWFAWNASNPHRRKRRSLIQQHLVEELEIRLLPAAKILSATVEVPSRAAGNQNYDSVAAHPDGTYTIVFSDGGFDSSGWGIYARRFSATGTPLGNQFRINSTVDGDQVFPSIATNQDGKSLIVWLNGNSGRVSLDLQFLNADGTLLGGNLNLIPPDYGTDGDYLETLSWSVANQPWTFADASGQFWVAVPIMTNSTAKAFDFWKVSPDGTLANVIQTTLIEEVAPVYSVPIPISVVLGNDGTFYVCYDVEKLQSIPDVGDQYTSQLFVRRLSSSTGEQIGGDILVHAATYVDDSYRSEHRNQIVVPQDDGKFSVVYYNAAGDIVVQPFDANGNRIGATIKFIDHSDLNPGYGLSPISVGTLSNGNWLMAWSVPIAFGPDTLHVREFQTNGVPVGSAILLGTASYAGAIHLARQLNDEFVATWQDGGGISGFGDVFARRVAANTVSAGITVIPPEVSQTTSAGGTATFQIVLTSAPTQTVSIPLEVTFAGIASLSTSQLDFTPSNWNIPRSVTVTGLDDPFFSEDVAYDVLIGPAISTDASYDGLTITPLTLEHKYVSGGGGGGGGASAGIFVSPTSGLVTSEAGGTAQFSVSLKSQPLEAVFIGLSSSNLDEGTPSKSTLTFTSENWDIPQTVVVTGVDDGIDDAAVVYKIVLEPSTSLDSAYDGINPADVTLTNQPVGNGGGGGTGGTNTPPTVVIPTTNTSFSKGSSAVNIAAGSTITDDSTNFAGGSLRIAITNGFTRFDVLNLPTTVDGVSLGTVQQSNGELLLDLNNNATPARLQRLLDQLTFSTRKKGLKSSFRTIEIQLTDSSGGTSSISSRTIQVSKKRSRG